MKLHIANPVTGCNKMLDVEDENKLRIFFEKRLGQEIEVDALGAEYKGYVLKITGGCDKAGFPMKQGVLTNSRVRLLIPKGGLGFQRWRGRRGERRRKSVRGCIVGSDIAVLNVIISKKGEFELEGLTNDSKPRTLGPKRASKIRRLFNLSKSDDLRKFVIKHKVVIGKKTPSPTTIQRGPKIQRLITPERLRRKKLIHNRMQERKTANHTLKTGYERLVKKRKQEAEDLKDKKTKKVEVKVEEPVKKVEVKKVDVKKVDVKKVDVKKVDVKKVEVKKVEPKVEVKKVETKKVETKKVETKKVEPKKEEKKAEKKPEVKAPVKKAEAKVETKKVETKKPETKKPDAKKTTEKK